MKKLSLKKINQKGVTPEVLVGLPDNLKTVDMYYTVESELAKMVKSDHKHKSVKEYVQCAWCNQKRHLRENKIKSYGFKSYAQFLEYRRIMDYIINKRNIQLK
jgi:hypothetical protein